MDTKQLELFLSVANSLNFTQAANEHYMTQPAVSHRISELERELGGKLFLRDSHSVILTSAGEAFIPFARDMLETARTGADRVYDIAHGKTGHLRILVVPGATSTASTIMEAFAKRHPEVSIEADIVTGTEQIRACSADQADIFFSMHELLSTFPQLHCRKLAERRFSLLLPRSCPLPVSPEDFSALHELSLLCEKESEAPALAGKAEAICSKRGLPDPKVHWCNSGNSLFLAVQSGLGFAVIPTPSEDYDPEGTRVIRLKGDDVMSDESIGWRKKTGNQSVSAFMEIVDELYPTN